MRRIQSKKKRFPFSESLPGVHSRDRRGAGADQTGSHRACVNLDFVGGWGRFPLSHQPFHFSYLPLETIAVIGITEHFLKHTIPAVGLAGVHGPLETHVSDEALGDLPLIVTVGRVYRV